MEIPVTMANQAKTGPSAHALVSRAGGTGPPPRLHSTVHSPNHFKQDKSYDKRNLRAFEEIIGRDGSNSMSIAIDIESRTESSTGDRGDLADRRGFSLSLALPSTDLLWAQRSPIVKSGRFVTDCPLVATARACP